MTYQHSETEVADGDLILGWAAPQSDSSVRETKVGYGVCSICSCAGFRSPGTSTDLCMCGHDFSDHG